MPLSRSQSQHERTHLWYPENSNLLLLEVPSVLFVYEDEVEVISRAELLVHITERRREVEAAKEEPYRDGLPCT